MGGCHGIKAIGTMRTRRAERRAGPGVLLGDSACGARLGRLGGGVPWDQALLSGKRYLVLGQ